MPTGGLFDYSLHNDPTLDYDVVRDFDPEAPVEYPWGDSPGAILQDFLVVFGGGLLVFFFLVCGWDGCK